jgi:hypothetical protein
MMLKVMIKRFLLSILLLMLTTSAIFATAQDPDLLIYNGKTYDLFSNPLENFYDGNKSKRPKFWVEPNSVSSGNWRGYVATWEIIDDKLYCHRHSSAKLCTFGARLSVATHFQCVIEVVPDAQ